MTHSRIHCVLPTLQRAPGEIVGLAKSAASSGADGVVLLDRFQPWLPSQRYAPSVWPIAGAIASAVDTEVTVSAVPGYRAHPATVAQAAATVCGLSGRALRLVLGAGDAIDEHIVGEYWPEASRRVERLFEASEIVRKLFASSRRRADVRHTGADYRLESSRLWLGDQPGTPAIDIWAAGAATARRAGARADGIVVPFGEAARMRKLLDALRLGAHEAGRPERELRATAFLQLCWAPTEQQAIETALAEWPMAGLRFPRGDIRSPFDIEQISRTVTPEQLRERVLVTSEASAVLAALTGLFEMGFSRVHVQHVGAEQQEWLGVLESEIIPRLAVNP